MEHLKIRRKKWKKENLQSCFDDHCCDIAINVLEEQAYSKGFHDGYEEAKDNMVTARIIWLQLY